MPTSRMLALLITLLVSVAAPRAWAQSFETEPNNNSGQANPLTSGASVHGQISNTTDEDWFSFLSTGTGRITVTLQPAPGGNLLPAAQLQDSLGNVLASSVIEYGYAGPLTTVTLQAGAVAGTYFIRLPAINSFQFSNPFTGVSTASYIMSAVFPSSGALPTVSTTIAPLAFSVDAGAASYLRIVNPTNVDGTVQITLRDDASTVSGTWTQRIAANSAPQFDMATIERGAKLTLPAIFADPSYPGFWRVEVKADFAGYAQNVLWNASAGVLTNLSICNQGTSASAGMVANVHTSILGSTGYPSYLLLTNGTAVPSSATITVLDSATGSTIGTWISPSIPGNGATVIAEADIEAGLHLVPTQPHLTMVLAASSPGFIGHFVNNSRSSVITDMTARCTLPQTTLGP